MYPFNTAKKIKSTEKVVIFIDGSATSGAPLRLFSYEKREITGCRDRCCFL
jgi:hypothetical protein